MDRDRILGAPNDLSDHIADSGGKLDDIVDDTLESGSENNNGYSPNEDDQLDDEEVAGGGSSSSRAGKRRKKHRHKPHQIKELERFFGMCPHPDEKQRVELGKRIDLDPLQVKFWFQNKRTQAKSKTMQKQNKDLVGEYNKLVKENQILREACARPLCVHCGGEYAFLANLSHNEEQLKAENLCLREQLAEAWSMAENVMGKSEAHEAIISNVDSANLPAAGTTSAGPLVFGTTGAPERSATMPYSVDNGMIIPEVGVPATSSNGPLAVTDLDYDRSPYLAVAISAMNEVLALALRDDTFWYRIFEGGKDLLNMEEYTKRFCPFGPLTPPGFIIDASRESAKVPIAAPELVKAFMSCERWADLFPDMIGQASVIEHLYSGHAGELQMMTAEFLFPSPFIPLRRDKFIRYSVNHQGMWIVVDSSVGNMAEGFYADTMRCRRLPSGIIAQDTSDGFSLVTWIEHIEYDETCAPKIYRPLLRSRLAFGADRWLAALQRQCEYSALMSISLIIKDESGGMTEQGARNIIRLAARMTASFGAAICASTKQSWKKLTMVGNDTQLMIRTNCSDPTQPSGVMLGMAMSTCLPVPRQKLFDFLCEPSSRSKWCVLSHGGPMVELSRISRCQDNTDSIALLYPPAAPDMEKNMLLLQQAWTDKTGSLLAYAPVDVQTMTTIMSGGDPNSIGILPSGFAIEDALSDCNIQEIFARLPATTGSSILTLELQFLYSNLPTDEPTVEFIDTVTGLMSHTIKSIKTALNCS